MGHILFLFLLLTPFLATAALPAPAGIFALTQARKEIPEWVLSHPHINGVVVRGDWSDVEPQEGQFNFSYFDTELERITRSGKVSSLVVTAGGRTIPGWLFSKNLEILTFINNIKFQSTYGQSISIPVFWDRNLINYKKRLITELGKRYSVQPSLKLVSAQCANASTDDWHIPESPAAITEWKRLGFSEERLINVCKEIIDITMQAFPLQIVRMAIGRVPPGLASKPDYVVRQLIAYAKEKYPGRFLVQRHNLAAPTPHANTGKNLFGWDVILDASPWSAAQFLWPAKDTKSCRLDRNNIPCNALDMFRRTVDAALTYGLRYVEVYASDLKDPELSGEVQRLARGLGVVTTALSNVKVSAAFQRPMSPREQTNMLGTNNDMRGAGNLAQHYTFNGKVSGKVVDYSIALPSSYASSGRRYPVIYWLHGKGGDAQRSTHVMRFINAAISAGLLPESIVVFPNGGKESFYTNDPQGSWPIETMIMEDLIPYIDASYRTISDRSGRVLMGFSMGGFGALKFAAKYPERFAGVVGYGAPRLDASLGMRGQDSQIYEGVFAGNASKFEQNTPAYLFNINRQRVLGQKLAIRLVAGSEDGTQHSVKKLHEVLDQLGIRHEYELLSGVRHQVPEYYNSENGKGLQFLGRVLTNQH